MPVILLPCPKVYGKFLWLTSSLDFLRAKWMRLPIFWKSTVFQNFATEVRTVSVEQMKIRPMFLAQVSAMPRLFNESRSDGEFAPAPQTQTTRCTGEEQKGWAAEQRFTSELEIFDFCRTYNILVWLFLSVVVADFSAVADHVGFRGVPRRENQVAHFFNKYWEILSLAVGNQVLQADG